MSVKSWIEEFYPIEASSESSDLEACKQAILKYSGCLDENLAKHNVILDKRYILNKDDVNKPSNYNIDIFGFFTDTCGFCLKYYSGYCANCPLFETTKVTCNIDDSPYGKFFIKGDVQTMIEALEKTLEYIKSFK